MKYFSKTRHMMATTAIGLSMMVAGNAAAAELSFTTYADPTNPNVSQVAPWMERVKQRTNGQVAFKIYYGGSLVPPRDALQGIGQGVAQGGQHVATYSPSLNPLTASLADLAFKVPDPLVVAFASTDYMLNDVEGKGEWLANNVVPLQGFSTTSYHFLCRDKDIDSVAKLKGKRIRTAGGPWSRFVKSIGAVDVNIPIGELYTALERGLVDCALADASHVVAGASLKDLLGSIVMLDVGPFFPGAALAMNRDTWNGLKPEQRRVMLDEVPVALVRMQLSGYGKLTDAGLAAAKAKGIQLNKPADDLVQAYKAFLGTIDADVIKAGKATRVANIEKEVADFSALLRKWDALLKNVNRKDEAALVKIVKAEIFDMIDAENLAKR